LEEDFLDTNIVKEILNNNYELDISEVESMKNIYKVITPSKSYCLKVIKYEFKHFFFILNAIKYLQSRGFHKIPEIIKTRNGVEYIKLGDSYAYLNTWVDARLSNYDNPVDVTMATLKLAELHEKSQGFTVTNDMKPRIGWLKWITTYKTRKDEILDFKNRISKKEKTSEFDEMYLRIMEDELDRAGRSLNNLMNSEYISKMKKEILFRGFCHHDYAYHNVLIDKENCVNIIDFDYCILDTHLHDLASLIIRVMKYGKWDVNKAKEILQVYSSIKSIDKEDLPIIAAFIEFPQDYWQRGIQYYWENKPWGEGFFIKKLEKYIGDREQRQEFAEELRKCNWL